MNNPSRDLRQSKPTWKLKDTCLSRESAAPAPTRPRHFYSRDGYLILVGRSSRQNDHLTNRMANPDDIWMHAKGVSGSHVIIRTGGKEVPPTTLLDGAMLAAYYSAARSSSNVAVDYVQRRHVRKPAGAPPGMVIYDHHKTLFPSPRRKTCSQRNKNDRKWAETYSAPIPCRTDLPLWGQNPCP